MVEHGAHRFAAVGVHPAEVLGGELNRCQRILDFVRNLARHLRPGLQAMRPFELDALGFELGGHAVEGVHQPAELVGRLDGDARVEVAARDAAGRAGQAAHGIGDALGHRQPDRRSQQHEEQRREMDPAIQLVDLALDFPLAKRERHRDEHIRPGGAHRRGGEHVVERSDRILAHEARLPLQDDRAIDVVGRAGRQDA